MTLRVLNVNSTLGLRTGGGTAERTFQMSRFLANQGVKCKVLTLDIDLDERRINDASPSTVVVLPCLWKRFYVPKFKWKEILGLVKEADIIHIMGHWGVLNVIVYLAARIGKKPYVVCPAGALPLFGRSRIIKRLYNWLIGYAIIRNASAWIAVTQSEFSHYLAYGISSEKITVIPNGVITENFSESEVQLFRARYQLSNVPFILFMGRLNPIKGPDILLEAFRLIHLEFPDFHLVFAGPDGGMLKELETLSKTHGLKEKIHFLGHIEGSEKSAAYHSAKLLVVPSRQEAMSIVALESGISGTPVLLTDQCGFSEITSVDHGLEVQATPQGIAKGLTNLLSDANRLAEISSKLREFVEARYSWLSIAPIYINLYRKILESKSWA